MQRHVHLGGLVYGQDDALLQVEPVVGADGDPQQAQGAHSKHAAQQRQRLPAAKAHTTASTAGGAAGGKKSCKGEMGGVKHSIISRQEIRVCRLPPAGKVFDQPNKQTGCKMRNTDM